MKKIEKRTGLRESEGGTGWKAVIRIMIKSSIWDM